MPRIAQQLAAALACGLVLFGAPSAIAQTYPEKPVKLVVGFPPGGGTDTFARLFGDRLSKKWNQAVIVENRPGADGTIAEEYVANAKPDGYTLFVSNSNFVVTPALHDLSFDPVTAFAPIVRVGTHPQILVVNPKVLPVNSVQELIEHAKANPGVLNFSSTGKSSSPFVAMKTFMDATGIELISVPYKGSAPAAEAMMRGDIQVAFNSTGAALANIQSGELKALAVSSNQRLPQLPDVPTVAEAANLPDFNVSSFDGLLAPAGTPAEIIQKIHADVIEIMNTPDVKEDLINSGSVLIGDSPEEFAAFIQKSIPKWKDFFSKIETN